MLGVREQIDGGRLVCPRTHQRLRVDGAGALVSADGAHSYRFDDGVPILVADLDRQREYREERRGSMFVEYSAPRSPSLLRRLSHGVSAAGYGHRTAASEAALQAVVATFALVDLAATYLRAFVPTWFLSRALWATARLLLVPSRALDRRLERSADAHVLASTVFAHLRKRERR